MPQIIPDVALTLALTLGYFFDHRATCSGTFGSLNRHHGVGDLEQQAMQVPLCCGCMHRRFIPASRSCGIGSNKTYGRIRVDGSL